VKKSIQLVVRFDAALVREIDKEQKRLERVSSGVRVTRSDAIRHLLRVGVGLTDLSRATAKVTRAARMLHPDSKEDEKE
jgi:hypothetical protein